jgi:hypothetical protein
LYCGGYLRTFTGLTSRPAIDELSRLIKVGAWWKAERLNPGSSRPACRLGLLKIFFRICINGFSDGNE